jgi:hypothetical protein
VGGLIIKKKTKIDHICVRQNVYTHTPCRNPHEIIMTPSGKRLHNYGKSPFVHGKIHYFYGGSFRYVNVYQAGYIPIDCRVTKPSPGGNGSASGARALSSCSSVVERSAPSKAPRFSATCRGLEKTTGTPRRRHDGATWHSDPPVFGWLFGWAVGHRIHLNPPWFMEVWHGCLAI